MGGATTAPAPTEKTSIYGTDLSIFETSRLIHKTVVSGSNQTVTIKGIGYEFEPLIVVGAKNITTHITIDLNDLDNPDGTFHIVAADTGTKLATFQGKKGIVKVITTFSTNGIYQIVKDDNVLGIVVIVDDIETVDLEKLRKDYLGG